ncbi:MAG TPA: hypothetical protein VFJ96_13895 [Gemmatimonadaceae bacterium]|nr:hypothetical protein [Gemmatimonadaceae bacterium]
MMLSQRSHAVVVPAALGPQLESWRLLWQELASDAGAMDEYRTWEATRRIVRPQLLELLSRYLAGAIDTEALRATFDHRTRTDWDAFGLRGMSGAMFLNKLVKHVRDGDALTARLRAVLPAPPDARTAAERLRSFVTFLDALERTGRVATGRLQPARAAFFLSMWWHLQDPARWPAFHPSARRVLEVEDSLYVPSGDPVDDYLAFREIFLSLASGLGRTVWELEYLCWWHHQREDRDRIEGDDAGVTSRTRRRRSTHHASSHAPSGPDVRARLALVRDAEAGRHVADPDAASHTSRASGLRHTEIQWLLATLGRALGCRAWIATNDRHREWNGERLGTLSIRALPSLGIHPESQRIVRAIDVVWLTGANEVAAAFEIERTTSVYSGLLRMADLAALSPNLNFPLYIVTPDDRLEKVRRELGRPTFQRLGLHRRCGFFSEEVLVDAADSLRQWASGPAAIGKLASFADDTPRNEPHG